MRILGIDPGYERVGIAVLEKNQGDKKEKLIHSECFKTSPSLPHHERLLLIGTQVKKVIEKYAPEALAIETLFFNNNQKTAMLVSEARGVTLYEAAEKGLVVHEYTPLQIKIAVTGYGRGTKEQVTSMVEKLVEIQREIKHDDEYDAIAVALTCFASTRSVRVEK